MDPTAMTFRLRPDQRAWLGYSSKLENRSLNGVIADLIDKEMKELPLYIVVSECSFEGSFAYDVTLGEYGEEIHYGDDKAAALAAAKAKAKEIGLPSSAVRYRISTDDNLYGPVVTSLHEGTIRRRAGRAGYRLIKSRRLGTTPDNQGRYMLVEASSRLPVFGYSYDADLGQIAAFLEEADDA